ncbi:hypothetical protein [Methylobacterium sp. Leaf85]|uniref:hypothetical protein n=1 Tax=Methylobacterium sp. Leaf85 TaxID=1736241 RepID=UPI0006FC24FA|nr:hypothetical protein [Methylobacterium sp. Leaf85]KQO43037.1 hypothetical protein ASF08_10700 [Methylobacterium sp. Leaf85]
MAGFDILADESAGGSTTIVVEGGASYPVSAGFGMLFGSAAGAVVRDPIFEGGLRAIHANGKTQSPIWYTEPTITRLASGTVNANATSPTLIKIMGGMDEVQWTHVSFQRFVTGTDGSLSPANLSGAIYAAPPVNGAWSDAAALIPVTALGDLGGRRGKRVECFHDLRRPVALWYRPVVRGATTFEVSVWGMPKWALNHAKPKA